MALIYSALLSIRAAAARLHREERAQDVIEYVVLAGFIGILAAAALVILLPDAFNNMATAISNCVQLGIDPYVCP